MSLYDAYAAIGRTGSQLPALTPEEEQSLLGSVGDTLLSGLSFVGNVLDTPGAIIRNTLAGTNPLQGLFDFDERTSGRQLLETWGDRQAEAKQTLMRAADAILRPGHQPSGTRPEAASGDVRGV